MKDKKRSKGFTLIELIAVLVILAIIALIVTPLVLNVVRKAKYSANKRSVDAYGKSIDLAVASYLLDTGDFPTSIDELTIEYSGKEVVCGIKLLNEDSSVYLSKCSVGGVEVKDSNNKDGYYHYGTTTTYKEYKIGDVITYNGMNFYVIENSDENSDSVTMLKAEPLTVDEVNTYGVDDTGISYINKYTNSSIYTASNYQNLGYGGMVYYSSETCGIVNSLEIMTNCNSDYENSDIKHVVDRWGLFMLEASDLKKDAFGYKIRLLTQDELTNNLGYSSSSLNEENTPSWVYSDNYWYWTMSSLNNTTVMVVLNDGSLNYFNIMYSRFSDNHGVVRPVMTILKSAI